MGVDPAAGLTSEPGRSEVRKWWQELIQGRVSRRQAHDWAAVWVDAGATISDPMVENALQHLHGFDLTFSSQAPDLLSHGDGEQFVHLDDAIVDALTRWEARCRRYDADPVSFREEARLRAMQILSEERRQS